MQHQYLLSFVAIADCTRSAFNISHSISLWEPKKRRRQTASAASRFECAARSALHFIPGRDTQGIENADFIRVLFLISRQCWCWERTMDLNAHASPANLPIFRSHPDAKLAFYLYLDFSLKKTLQLFWAKSKLGDSTVNFMCINVYFSVLLEDALANILDFVLTFHCFRT